jgi:hypothetical protein
MSVPPPLAAPQAPVVEKNFIDSFCQTFDLFSYNNSQYGRLCAHVLLGQKLKNIRIYFGPFYIDPRISIFIMQSSGTGKSIAYDVISKVAEGAGIKVNDMAKATDAALVGTVEPEEVYDPESKTKIITYNVKKGLLAESDILHYDEGKMLLTKEQYTQDTLPWFQKVLNPIGSGPNFCSKKLAHGEAIEFAPTCSLLITSHDINNLMDTVLDTGFFQRIVLYPRYVPIDERKDNEMLRASRWGRRIHTEINETALSETLNRIGEKYENFEISVEDKVYPLVKSEIDQLYKSIESAHERVREIMATFAPRYNNLMYIFSFHHSAASFKSTIDIEDVKYGASLTKLLFKEVMSWVEENITLTKLNSREQSVLNSAIQIYNAMEKDEHGFVLKFSFMKNCQTKWGLSMHTVGRYTEKFKGLRKMKEIETGNSLMIKFEIEGGKKR